MRSRFSKDNSGFSLIELIVVVLILGIMSGGAVIAMSTIMSARVSSASSMTTNLLKQGRQKAMSVANETKTKTYEDGTIEEDKTDVFVEFYKSDKDYYGSVKQTVLGVEVDLLTEKLCNDYVDIKFLQEFTGTTWQLGTTGCQKVRIYFKKGNGSIVKIFAIDGTTETKILPDTIIIDKPDSTDAEDTKTLIIVEGTGRVYEDH